MSFQTVKKYDVLYINKFKIAIPFTNTDHRFLFDLLRFNWTSYYLVNYIYYLSANHIIRNTETGNYFTLALYIIPPKQAHLILIEQMIARYPCANPHICRLGVC